MPGYAFPDVVYQPNGPGSIRGGYSVASIPGSPSTIYTNDPTRVRNSGVPVYDNAVPNVPPSAVYAKYDIRFDDRQYYSA